MSENEIRRRVTESPEIDAMVVIEQALERLDGDARKRVMTWAEERWIGAVLQLRIDRDAKATEEFSDATNAMSRFMASISGACKELNTAPIDLIRAAVFISDKANELKEADQKATAAT